MIKVIAVDEHNDVIHRADTDTMNSARWIARKMMNKSAVNFVAIVQKNERGIWVEVDKIR